MKWDQDATANGNSFCICGMGGPFPSRISSPRSGCVHVVPNMCVCVCSYAFPIHIYCQKPSEALMDIQLIIYSTREKGSNLPSFVVEAPLAWYRESSAGCGVDWFVLLACVQLFSFEERACRLLLDGSKVVYHCWEPETRLFVLPWVIAWWQHLEHSA